MVGVQDFLAQVGALLNLQVLVHQRHLLLECRLSLSDGGGGEACRLQLLGERGHEREVLRIGERSLVGSLKLAVHNFSF